MRTGKRGQERWCSQINILALNSCRTATSFPKAQHTQASLHNTVANSINSQQKVSQKY